MCHINNMIKQYFASLFVRYDVTKFLAFVRQNVI